MGSRTTRDYMLNYDPWPIITAWANETGFGVKQSTGPGRLFQKGHGILVAPMMLEIQQRGNQFHFEAWIRVNTFTRLFAFFLIPAEMGIESGGFKLVVPRKIARDAINKLMARLQLPPIP
jgi:hypothetical protein